VWPSGSDDSLRCTRQRISKSMSIHTALAIPRGSSSYASAAHTSGRLPFSSSVPVDTPTSRYRSDCGLFRGMTTTANLHGKHYAVIAGDRTQTFQNGIYGKHGRDSPQASPPSDLLVTAGAPGPQRRMHNNSLSFARSWRTARVRAALAAAGFLRKSDRERGRAPDVVNGDFLWRVMVGERLS